MKKPYVKPEVYFESFELSTSIATGCAHITNHAKDQCAYTVGGRKVFVDAVAECVTKTNDGTWDSLCYQIPTDGNKLFTS